MDYTVNSDTFNDFWFTLLLEISETSMALLLYELQFQVHVMLDALDHPLSHHVA
ncbi:hypothetical protein C8R44DRAFT_883088 [Mycena epipterygia]|nr:hypothetical protein C8R44DRAFT_883088 [Mycena epipterygia]